MLMEKKEVIRAISSFISDALESLMKASQYCKELKDDRELQWVFLEVRGVTQVVYGLWEALHVLQSKMMEKKIEKG